MTAIRKEATMWKVGFIFPSQEFQRDMKRST